jgi:hypothetical protein
LPYRFLANIWKLKTEIWKIFLILFWPLTPDDYTKRPNRSRQLDKNIRSSLL